MEKHEWAWLAGLFEGEGTIGFTGRTSVCLRIGMTDEDVIETVHRLFPTSNTWSREMKNRIKPLHVWQLSSRDAAQSFLEGVLPFLHSRRGERAHAALERLKANPGAKHLRTHCIHGHPLSGDNLYVASTGSRYCKTCRKQRDQARQESRNQKRQLAKFDAMLTAMADANPKLRGVR